ncbi:hypothetical protein [Paenibacillus sp. PL2-23]|uniref:hypothetical protein n=1 Tax=Paenibacillus sp. PL2-23 TaxID=2100729 RepID=UPI0030FA28AD
MIRNDERGYALMLVVFMILLFTLLGVSILGASLGGAVRTETKENDVQSLHLAEKALNEAVSYLVSEYNGRLDISPDELQLYMDSLQQKDSDEIALLTGSATNTELLGAGAQITDIEVVKDELNDLSYKLTLTAEAEVNGVRRTLVQEVYIDSYPEFLRYAYGSEQNVIMNGSPYGMGNIYAGGELLIDNRAEYTYKGLVLREPTQYPEIDGDLFVQSLASIKYHDPLAGGYVSIPTNNPSKLKEIAGVGYENVHIRDSSKFISINVEESFLDKAAEAAGSPPGLREELEAVFSEANLNPFIQKLVEHGVGRITYRAEPKLPNWDDADEVLAYEIERKDYEDNYLSLFNSPLTGSVIFDDDLTLDGISYKQLVYGLDLDAVDAKSKGKWFIVNGDLKIDNYSVEDLIVKANILVTGTVAITGENIKVDSTIFCLGLGEADPTTIVQDAELQGIEENGAVKQLVLISKPKILLNRFEAFTNFGRFEDEATIRANTLDAFFYTDGEAELYGVGSMFWLNGGFFAKGDLTINAVLGHVTEKPDETGIDFNTIQSLPSVNELDSRFIIDYNKQIFEDQNTGLPRVKQISVLIGKRQLKHGSQ